MVKNFGQTCALSEFRSPFHLRTIGKNNCLKGAHYRNFIYLCTCALSEYKSYLYDFQEKDIQKVLGMEKSWRTEGITH